MQVVILDSNSSKKFEAVSNIIDEQIIQQQKKQEVKKYKSGLAIKKNKKMIKNSSVAQAIPTDTTDNSGSKLNLDVYLPELLEERQKLFTSPKNAYASPDDQ